MKEENDFYIGWMDDVPQRNSAFLKKILIPVFVLIPILVFAVVFFQKPFNNFIFELGKTTTITGTYYEHPLPMLIADKGGMADSLSHDVILVGFGKSGAKGVIKNIEKENGSLHGKKITIKGTLIYGDGKTLMELTEDENSFVEIVAEKGNNPISATASKEVSLAGEIIDPKCYFGVMKPAEGKIHKSCAIRCISGGVPPVLRTKDSQGAYEYYIILDQNGQSMNKDVLPFVAEQITVTGKVNQFSNWKVLHIDINDIQISPI